MKKLFNNFIVLKQDEYFRMLELINKTNENNTKLIKSNVDLVNSLIPLIGKFRTLDTSIGNLQNLVNDIARNGMTKIDIRYLDELLIIYNDMKK